MSEGNYRIKGNSTGYLPKNDGVLPSTQQNKMAPHSSSLVTSKSLQASLLALQSMIGSGGVQKRKRKEIIEDLTRSIIENPLHPCSHIESDLRQNMIESIVDALVEAPLPLPNSFNRKRPKRGA